MRGKSTYQRCCEVLEVTPGAPMSEIEHSFRQLIKVWHPDRFADNPSLQSRATEKTTELTRSFQWLRRHQQAIHEAARIDSTPERVLSALRRSIFQYVERNPGTSDEIVERAVRALLLEVKVPPKQEKIYPFRWIQSFSLGRVGTYIYERRRRVLAWSLLVLLFLLFGSRS